MAHKTMQLLSRGLVTALAVAWLGTLSSCTYFAKPAERIPTFTVPAVQPGKPGEAKQLVIVLPGRGDDIARLRKFGVADAIHQAMPSADVLLVELTLPYYMQGRSMQRLHDEIVQPARQQGYRDIVLSGASMGGMGVIMYEHEYPGEIQTLVLMAPFMGDPRIPKEIRAADGLANWDAGPAPPTLTKDTVPQEEWRVVKSWSANPERARSVWLICGTHDKFYPSAQVIRPALPADHYIEVDGGHAWVTWKKGISQALAAARTD